MRDDIDEIDRELLRLLTQNSRLSAAELSRELAVSRSTIQNRVERLLATGRIKKFTIEPGKEAASVLVDAMVLIKLKAGDSRKTIAQLKNIAEVEALTSSNGTYDFILDLRVSSLIRLDQILMDIRQLPMVADTNSSIRLKRFK